MADIDATDHQSRGSRIRSGRSARHLYAFSSVASAASTIVARSWSVMQGRRRWKAGNRARVGGRQPKRLARRGRLVPPGVQLVLPIEQGEPGPPVRGGQSLHGDDVSDPGLFVERLFDALLDRLAAVALLLDLRRLSGLAGRARVTASET